MLWEVDASQKYRLTSSALAMIARLMPEKKGQCALKSLPGTGIWMTLEDEKRTNVYFSSIAHAATSYFEIHPHARVPKKLETIIAKPWIWDFQVMAMGDHPLLYLYDAEFKRWTLNNVDLCPVHLCEKLAVDNRKWPSWYICDVCRPAFEYWTSWFPVALMAVNLDFAETEEKREPKQLTEREIRKKRVNTGYKETPVLHTYHVITFDISVKEHVIPASPSEPGEPSHPTWLEQAIKDETVLYVEKHIEQTQRTFKHERYVNMRGKTIDVRPYDKRIPMSVKRLKQTINQAIASYEGIKHQNLYPLVPINLRAMTLS
jgi:hypothetical protein